MIFHFKFSSPLQIISLVGSDYQEVSADTFTHRHRKVICMLCINALSAVVFACVRTHGVDGYPVDASVLRLELLQENSHAVAERLEGELTALSPGRQTDREHRQPVLIRHRHLWEGHREEKRGETDDQKVLRVQLLPFRNALLLCQNETSTDVASELKVLIYPRLFPERTAADCLMPAIDVCHFRTQGKQVSKWDWQSKWHFGNQCNLLKP